MTKKDVNSAERRDLNTEAKQSAIRCPRCGYDQRGAIATWIDSCPLQGTCSECGLRIAWSEVLVSEKYEPRWCVEFAALRSIIQACLSTSVRSFRPWIFWSRLRMSQRIRWLRLMVYCAWLLLPLVLVYIGSQSIVAAMARSKVQQNALAQWSQVGQQVAFAQQMAQSGQFAAQTAGLTPQERATVLSQFNAQVASLQLQASSPPVIEQSYPEAILEAVLFPFGFTSWGSIRWADGTVQPYPAPSEIYDIARGGWSSYNWSDEAFRGGMAILCMLLFVVLLPASFVLLPISRKRAKVRWAHLARITLYSLVLLSSALVIQYLGTTWTILKPVSTAKDMMHYGHLIVWIGLPIWWAAAVRRYLHMPHAAGVAALLSLIIALLLAPCLITVLPQWLVRLILG